MSDNNLVPATWPDAECEFYQHPHALAELRYHIEVECSRPQSCHYAVVHDAHFIALDARSELSALWCSRVTYPPTGKTS